MSSWNLENFNNIYSSISQSSYKGRPALFIYEKLTLDQRELLDSGNAIEFDFSKDANYTQKINGKEYKGIIEGSQNLPNDGIVGLKIIN
ncbi:hypothetical protein [Streptococcus agalactiae]|uniref:hypothetical protein n=1 Tax=Streptococcus agalactiae TaxID=1311 RepID=UPI003C70D959